MISRSRSSVDRTGSMFHWGLHVCGWGGLVFLIVPLMVATTASFGDTHSLRFPPERWSVRWYQNLLTDKEWVASLTNSLTFGVCVASVSVFIGLAGAYGSLYVRRSLRMPLLFAFILPAVTPPVIIGVGQLLLFSRLGIIDTALGVVISHVTLAFPFSFAVLLGAIGQQELELERIAMVYGARRWYAFVKVTCPMIKRGLVGAFFLSFIVSFDEAVVVLYIVSHKARTLPRQIFDGLRYDLDPTVAAVAGLAMLLWIAAIAMLPRRHA